MQNTGTGPLAIQNSRLLAECDREDREIPGTPCLHYFAHPPNCVQVNARLCTSPLKRILFDGELVWCMPCVCIKDMATLSCFQADRRLDSEEGEACSGQKAHLLKALQLEMNSVTVRPVLQVVHDHLSFGLKEHTSKMYMACMQSG